MALSLVVLGIWIIIFLLSKKTRKEMFWVSLFTMPFGLTEPLFVPAYWNPPSLFNLAAKTGFDVESLIFSFAIGGVGSVLYEISSKAAHKKMARHEMRSRIHRFHLLAIVSPVIVFLPLHIFTTLNPIYSASIAMFVGGIAAVLCRPDLKNKVLIGGLMFLLLYFISFLALNIMYPGVVYEVWNLKAISSILILEVPLEELIFAFTFGMLWSSIYEHALWYKLETRRK